VEFKRHCEVKPKTFERMVAVVNAHQDQTRRKSGRPPNGASLTRCCSRSNTGGSIALLVVEHVLRHLKIFRLLAERNHNRRRRFSLRFNLIAGLYNLKLNLN
jgi:hypothetical protein